MRTSDKSLLTLVETLAVFAFSAGVPPNENPLQLTALDAAINAVKAAGYRISKPRKPKSPETRVGPTFVAEFADGEVTRMSTFTSLEKLDWGRGERLAQAAYGSRWRRVRRIRADFIEPVLPAIVSAHFEQDGIVLARRPDDGGVS